MGWRIVLQPDGKLARFSDVVDNFTDYDMTEDEAVECCREYLGRFDAERKVQAGLDDIKPWSTRDKGNGQARWRHCLEAIVRVHGYETLKSTLEEMQLVEHLPPESSFETE